MLKGSSLHKFCTCPCEILVCPRSVSFKVSIYWAKHSCCSIVQRQKNGNGFVVGCARWSLEREVKAHEDEEKGRSGMGRYRHNCGEGEGVVELLECLEREAIMGEDAGKDPIDYNRRAHIFDTSSQVFQALKELNNHSYIELNRHWRYPSPLTKAVVRASGIGEES
ncbi:hypothetical protein CR513_43840, partial [Mucuna pruriens]